MWIRRLTHLSAIILIGGLISTPSTSAAESPSELGASVRPGASNMETLEVSVGRQFDGTRLSSRWDDAFPSGYAAYLQQAGQQMLLSVQAQTRNDVVIRWADIATAQPGSALHNNMVRWARSLRDLRVPIGFTFHQQPEAAINLNNGSAAEYIAAWRKFHSILEEQGASNVRFMWIMTAQAFRLEDSDRRYAPNWYPGDQYVDGIASDAYNWYKCRADVDSPWRSLAYLVDGQRDFGAEHPSKDLYITDWATAEDPDLPGRKEQWIRDAQALLKTPAYAQFEDVTYLNMSGQGDCVWDVHSSPEALQEPADDFLWGMSYNGGENPTAFEQRVGATVEMRRFFVPSQNITNAVRGIREDMAAGRDATQVSFKLDASWAQAAAGASDAWARDAARQIAAAVGNTGHEVQVAIQHEPENDTGTNNGSTIAGRDAWVAMNARLGPIFRAAGLKYGVIIMGYHSMPNTSGNRAVWLLEKWLPQLAGKADFLGLDVYQGSWDTASFETSYLKYIKAQTAATGLTWGLSESAITPESFTTSPGWFEAVNRLLPQYGASFYSYFNTPNNNLIGTLYMSAGESREQAYVKVLKTHQ